MTLATYPNTLAKTRFPLVSNIANGKFIFGRFIKFYDILNENIRLRMLNTL
jgi:hypothetical protein